MSEKTKINRQAGFSLVELAVVLIIIGLIVGGILKGQDLLESARLKSILTQANEYRLATATFMEKYGSLPGDYDKASEYIDGSLLNGNNDGRIEGPGLAVNPGGYNHEARSFWAHLAAANLITHPGQPHGGHAQFDKGVPSTKIGGGFTLRYQPHPEMVSHWFVIGAENGDTGDGPLLTPVQAMSIDVKADNGDPTRGQIQAKSGAGGNAGLCVKANGLYNTDNKDKACVLYIKL